MNRLSENVHVSGLTALWPKITRIPNLPPPQERMNKSATARRPTPVQGSVPSPTGEADKSRALEGKPRVCTFSGPTEKGSAKGTLYAMGSGAGARKRSDITMTLKDNTKIELHIINDSKVAYVWGSSNHGIKSSAEERSVDEILKHMDFKCKAWTPDNRVFQIPANIKFTEITKGK